METTTRARLQPLHVVGIIQSSTIYRAKNVFSHIDPDFKGLKILMNVNNPAQLKVHELAVDGTFLKNFSSLSSDIGSLSLTEEAVVRFCMINKNFITGKKQKAFFYLGDNVIAKVKSCSDGLHIDRYRLDSPIIWWARKKHLFIVPKF